MVGTQPPWQVVLCNRVILFYFLQLKSTKEIIASISDSGFFPYLDRSISFLKIRITECVTRDIDVLPRNNLLRCSPKL